MAERVVVSVDTWKPAVAEAVLAAGADDRQRRLRPARPRPGGGLCARHGGALVVMHTRARPKKKDFPDYWALPTKASSVTSSGSSARSSTLARSLGVAEESLIVDPGPDFAKTPAETVAVLRALPELARFGRPVLLAVSRKDFVGALTSTGPWDRGAGTLAAVGEGVDAGALILRVHEVDETARFLAVRAAPAGRGRGAGRPLAARAPPAQAGHPGNGPRAMSDQLLVDTSRRRHHPHHQPARGAQRAVVVGARRSCGRRSPRPATDAATRVVVLTGAGEKAFCAGADLSGMAAGAGYAELHDGRGELARLFRDLWELGKPTIAKVRGLVPGRWLRPGPRLRPRRRRRRRPVRHPRGRPRPVALHDHRADAALDAAEGRARAADDRPAGRAPTRPPRIGFAPGGARRRARRRRRRAGRRRSPPSPRRCCASGRDAFYAVWDQAAGDALRLLHPMLTVHTGLEDAAEGLAAFAEKRDPVPGGTDDRADPRSTCSCRRCGCAWTRSSSGPGPPRRRASGASPSWTTWRHRWPPTSR